MAVKKMGFEGPIYYGVAGAQASSAIENSRDITYSLDTETGSTKVRGDGSSPPINTERVTGRVVSIDFQTIYKSDDSVVEAMLVASFAGTPVALRTKSYSSGKGYDGDVILKHKWNEPISGEQTIDWTATPNDDARAIAGLYV